CSCLLYFAPSVDRCNRCRLDGRKPDFLSTQRWYAYFEVSLLECIYGSVDIALRDWNLVEWISARSLPTGIFITSSSLNGLSLVSTFAPRRVLPQTSAHSPTNDKTPHRDERGALWANPCLDRGLLGGELASLCLLKTRLFSLSVYLAKN